jgi:branched-chain amino acid transport system substrate-binding protein
MVNETFARQIAGAAGSTYLSTPVLPVAAYPSSAQRLFARYEAQFGEAGGPYALYGYEAMSVVLQAIRDAGPRGDERQAVIDRFFAIHDRDSVLGRYSIDADGDSTLTRYGVDRIVGGKLVFWRALNG